MFYRQQVAGWERSPGDMPAVLQAERDEFQAQVEAWRTGELTEAEADEVVERLAPWRVGSVDEVMDIHAQALASSDKPEGVEGGRKDRAIIDLASFRRPMAADQKGQPGAGTASCEPEESPEAAGWERMSAALTAATHGDARMLALLFQKDGAALFAFREQADINSELASITYDEALERLFGEGADRLCQRLGFNVDGPSRTLLLREIGEAYRQVEAKRARNMNGDYSTDKVADRFPTFEPVPAAVLHDRQRGESRPSPTSSSGGPKTKPTRRANRWSGGTSPR